MVLNITDRTALASGVEELAKFLKASGIKDVRAAVREFTTDIVIFRIWK